MYSFALYLALIFLFLTVIGCVSISAFASVVGITIRNYEFSSMIKNLCITAGIKKHKSIIKKNKKKHGKIVLIAKSKLDSIEVLISKALIDSNISHDEFVLINVVLKEF